MKHENLVLSDAITPLLETRRLRGFVYVLQRTAPE